MMVVGGGGVAFAGMRRRRFDLLRWSTINNNSNNIESFDKDVPKLDYKYKRRHRLYVEMLLFVHPFTAIDAGPTSCGRTRFVFRLIDNAPTTIYPPPAKIVYCYGKYQELFRQYPRIQFREGLPNIGDFDGREPTLLIVDDLMQETNENE